jgi:hypothetical protein
MKFFLDRKKREFVKGVTSNVPLDHLVLKRRDLVPIEFVFVENGAPVTLPAGTEIQCALKTTFSAPNFLALATGPAPTLDLNTVPLENAFATGAAALPALIEVRWLVPGETLRTATLSAEVQNSVILGAEGTPQAMPDGKATQAEAEAGSDNDKWMTPLRTAQAVALETARATTAEQLLSAAIEQEAISRALSDVNLASLLGTKAPAQHTHTIADIAGLQSALDGPTPADSYTEATFTDGQLTAMTTWTDSSKAQLVQTKTLTYTGVDLTQIAITDAAGALVLTKTLAYSGGNLASITEDFQ